MYFYYIFQNSINNHPQFYSSTHYHLNTNIYTPTSLHSRKKFTLYNIQQLSYFDSIHWGFPKMYSILLSLTNVDDGVRWRWKKNYQQRYGVVIALLDINICQIWQYEKFHYKILHQWYLTPARLSRKFPGTSDTCWHCSRGRHQCFSYMVAMYGNSFFLKEHPKGDSRDFEDQGTL